MARLIHRGAEAEVYEKELWGLPVIEKRRIKKDYRHPALDTRLRIARTRLEARILMRAKEKGVRCPAVLDIWEDTLLLEEVEGPTLLEILKSEPVQESLAEELGRQVGLMHAAGIVHNDLTPLNVILTGEREVCLLDFGLGEFSKSVEDMAVDLHVLKKSVAALVPSEAERFFEAFLRGYRGANPKADLVVKRLEKVEARGRYRSWIG